MRAIQIPMPKMGPALSYCKAYAFGECRIFVGKEPPGWHMSISHPSRYPTWDEIRDARYELVPDGVTMAMLLPPRSQYVNVHSFCFHLHEIEGE